MQIEPENTKGMRGPWVFSEASLVLIKSASCFPVKEVAGNFPLNKD